MLFGKYYKIIKLINPQQKSFIPNEETLQELEEAKKARELRGRWNVHLEALFICVKCTIVGRPND